MGSMQQALHLSMVVMLTGILLDRMSVSVLEMIGYQIYSIYIVFLVCFNLLRVSS